MANKMTDESRIGYLLCCMESREDFKPDFKYVAEKLGINFDAARKRLPGIKKNYDDRIAAAATAGAASGSGGAAGVTPAPTPSTDGDDGEANDNGVTATPSKKRKVNDAASKKTATPKKAATPKTPKAAKEKTPRKPVSAKKASAAALSSSTVNESDDDSDAKMENARPTTPTGDEEELFDPVTPKATTNKDNDTNLGIDSDEEGMESTIKKRKTSISTATPTKGKGAAKPKTPVKPKTPKEPKQVKERTPAQLAALEKRRVNAAAKRAAAKEAATAAADGASDEEDVDKEDSKTKTPTKKPRAKATPKSGKAVDSANPSVGMDAVADAVVKVDAKGKKEGSASIDAAEASSDVSVDKGNVGSVAGNFSVIVTGSIFNNPDADTSLAASIKDSEIKDSAKDNTMADDNAAPSSVGTFNEPDALVSFIP